MSERLTATLTASLPTAQPLHRAFTHLLTEWLPTMQDCLTHFLSGFELGAFSYFAVAFIGFAFNRSQATPASAAPAITPAPTTAITETTTQPSEANKPESIAPAIVEAARSMPQPQPKQAAQRQLKPTEPRRQPCSRAGIQCRKAKGKGNHFTVVQRQRLGENASCANAAIDAIPSLNSF